MSDRRIIDRVRSSIANSIVNWSMKNFERGDRGTTVIETENARNVYGLYTEEFSQLTSANIKFYLEADRRGLGWFKVMLFEEIRKRDLHIGGVCQTREIAVNGKHNLSTPEEYVNCEDEELMTFTCDMLKHINLEQFAADVTNSGISGVSNFELMFKPEGGKWILDQCKKIHNALLVYDDRIDKYFFLAKESLDLFKLRNAATVIGSEDRIRIEDLSLIEIPKERLLEVHSLGGNAGHGLQNGCMDAIIWGYLFKSYSIKDLHVFIELFAIPAIIGKYDPLMSETDKAKLRTAIQNFGNHFRMTVSKDADVEFITDTNKSSSSDIFHTTINYWDNKISIRVLGQTLTTEIGSNGSYAAAQTHNAVREDLLRADISVVQKAVNELIKKACDLNFDMSSREYPVFTLPESLSIADKSTLADVYTKVKNLGYKVSKEQVENELETGSLEQAEEQAIGNREQGEDTRTQEEKDKEKKEKEDFVKKFVSFVERVSMKNFEADKETEEFINEIFDRII